MIKKIELWPHQRESLEAFFQSRDRRGTISIPTGGGKTFMAISAWVRQGEPRLLVVAPTGDLILQWQRVFKKVGIPPFSVGLFYAHEKSPNRAIVITTYASLRMPKYLELLLKGRKFIIADESHHLEGLKTRTNVLNAIRQYAPDAYLMCLSATFKFLGQAKRAAVKSFAPVVYECSTKKLIDEGYLADPTLMGIPVSFSFEEAERYSQLQVQFMQAYGKASRIYGRDMSRWPKSGDAILGAVYRLMNDRNSLRTMLKQKDNALLQILKEEFQKRGKELKAMVFTSYIPHLERLSNLLNRNGIPSKAVHNKIKWNERKQRIKDWAKGRFNVLLVAEIGGEGLDVPEANVGVIIGGAKNKEKAIQKMGRIIRSIPRKIKKPSIYFVYLPVIEDIWLTAAVSELGRPIFTDSRFEDPTIPTKDVVEGKFRKEEPLVPRAQPVTGRRAPFPSSDGYNRFKEVRMILIGRPDANLYDRIVSEARTYHGNAKASSFVKDKMKQIEGRIYSTLTSSRDMENGWELIKGDLIEMDEQMKRNPVIPDKSPLPSTAPPYRRVESFNAPTPTPYRRQMTLTEQLTSSNSSITPLTGVDMKMRQYVLNNLPIERYKVMTYFVYQGYKPLIVISAIKKMADQNIITEYGGRLIKRE